MCVVPIYYVFIMAASKALFPCNMSTMSMKRLPGHHAFTAVFDTSMVETRTCSAPLVLPYEGYVVPE